MKFSYFNPPVTNTKSIKEINLDEIFELISSKDTYGLIESRKLEEKVQQKYKSKILPFVTFSGQFEERKYEKLKTYSGLICIDIDKLESEEDAHQLKEKLFKLDIKPILAFISPRGKGVKAIYGKIEKIGHHLEAFNLLEKYIKQEINIEIDKSGKDIARACFISYDKTTIYQPSNLFSELICMLKEKVKINNISIHSNENEQTLDLPITLEDAIENVRISIRKSVKGEKHVKLLKASTYLGGFIYEKFKFAEAEDILKSEINKKEGVDDFELAYKTISNGLKNGMLNPIFEKPNKNDDYLDGISNSIIKNLKGELPNSLKGLLENYKLDHEKDIAFLSVITLLSSLTPEFYFKYGKKDKYHLNLFTYIIGNSGSGKSNANISLSINRIIQEDICKNLDWKYALLAGDTSKASLIELINENKGNAYIHETETDTLTSANKQEWGHFSDLLRKAFEHEANSVSRKKKEKSQIITIDYPRMSILLTSTPNQLPFLIPNTSDGLSIRFIYYSIEKRPKWQNQFEEESISKISSELICDIIKILEYQSVNKDLELEFNENDKNRIDTFFENRFYDFDDELHKKMIVRMPVIFLRIVAVIHLLFQAKSENIDLNIKSETIDIGFEIIKELIEHSDKVLNTLPKMSLFDNLTVTQKYYFNLLPDEFKISQLNDPKIDIRNRTFQKLLKNDSIFEKVRRGEYKKKQIR